MAADSVKLIVDKRSVRSFSRNVDALINVASNDMLNTAIEFAEEVLADSNAKIPVDTGTAAMSAGYNIEPAYNGSRVRMGYTVTSNPTNPRTGESASTYITTLHEDLSVQHSNGEAKFFEKALISKAETLAIKGHEKLAARLAGSQIDTSKRSIKHTDYMSPALSRVQSGFTATHAGGQYLPFPADRKQLKRK